MDWRLERMGTGGIRWREREYWDRWLKLGAFQGCGRNSVQWKLHEVYEGDPSKDLVMVGTEPEPVILCNQARTQVDGVGHQPATEPPTHSLSCLHDVLGPKPHQRDHRDFFQEPVGADAEAYRQMLGSTQGVLHRRRRKREKRRGGGGIVWAKGI